MELMEESKEEKKDIEIPHPSLLKKSQSESIPLNYIHHESPHCNKFPKIIRQFSCKKEFFGLDIIPEENDEKVKLDDNNIVDILDDITTKFNNTTQLNPPPLSSLDHNLNLTLNRSSSLPVTLGLLREYSSVDEKFDKLLNVCQICLESFSEEFVSLCGNDECKMFCILCLEDYINQKLESAFGRCPIIKCPNSSCTSFLHFSSWKDIVKKSIVQQYLNSAKSMLFLKCGNCHEAGSLLKTNQKTLTECLKRCREYMPNNDEKSIEFFRDQIKAYKNYELSVDDFYNYLTTFIPKVKQDYQKKIDAIEEKQKILFQEIEKQNIDIDGRINVIRTQVLEVEAKLQKEKEMNKKIKDLQEKFYGNSAKAINQLEKKLNPLKQSVKNLNNLKNLKSASQFKQIKKNQISINQYKNLNSFEEKDTSIFNSVFKEVLDYIGDDLERRSALHLKYCLHFPFIRSLCCEEVHCFKCQIVGKHKNSCEQHSLMYKNLIKRCPNCNAQIVKGDGCSHITCICGSSFYFEDAEYI